MKRIFWAILLIGTVAPGATIADTYICTVKPQETGGWIPSTLAIDYNTQTGEVIVYDEIIKHFRGKPLAGKVATDNKKRITFTWTLPSVRDSSGNLTLRFNFRASYLKRTRKMIVTSSPAGYEDNFRGQGTCKIE